MRGWGTIPVVLGLLLASVLPLALAGSALATDDPVLARLHRIARGSWMPAPRSHAHVPYAAQIRRAASRHGISPSLLAALVRAESAFNPSAVSSAGAQGLGQLMPATARRLGVADPFDPVENLEGAARYVSQQLARFRSVQRALVAYHAGPERARAGLRAAPRSTRAYVSRVMRFEREYREHGLP
ncbi:MAG: lytic transglycosylase domain-containing protein [Deltaproteobacteria bacterium]|nr:lytic transglycosylase domain-containing protein [Deltaproteobacteria bacterium]MCZ6823408.1 lytic transglycosylase domain-containing protein [Deltaproteobacteria bacterium]